jgi:hypothetical protein
VAREGAGCSKQTELAHLQVKVLEPPTPWYLRAQNQLVKSLSVAKSRQKQPCSTHRCLVRFVICQVSADEPSSGAHIKLVGLQNTTLLPYLTVCKAIHVSPTDHSPTMSTVSRSTTSPTSRAAATMSTSESVCYRPSFHEVEELYPDLWEDTIYYLLHLQQESMDFQAALQQVRQHQYRGRFPQLRTLLDSRNLSVDQEDNIAKKAAALCISREEAIDTLNRESLEYNMRIETRVAEKAWNRKNARRAVLDRDRRRLEEQNRQLKEALPGESTRTCKDDPQPCTCPCHKKPAALTEADSPSYGA